MPSSNSKTAVQPKKATRKWTECSLTTAASRFRGRGGVIYTGLFFNLFFFTPQSCCRVTSVFFYIGRFRFLVLDTYFLIVLPVASCFESGGLFAIRVETLEPIHRTTAQKIPCSEQHVRQDARASSSCGGQWQRR